MQPTYPPEPPMGPQRFAAYGPKQTAMHEPWEFTRRVRPLGRIPVCSCRAGRHQYSQRLPAQLSLSPSLSRPILVLVLVPSSSSCSSSSSGLILIIIFLILIVILIVRLILILILILVHRHRHPSS